MKSVLEKRKLILIGAAVLMCSWFTLNVKADTIAFNVTVNSMVMNKDPLSYKTDKFEDNDNYYYVTPTYFSANGYIKVRSVNDNNYNIKSGWANLYSYDGAKKYPYGSNVPKGELYYMQSDYGNATSSEVNVTGYYTP